MSSERRPCHLLLLKDEGNMRSGAGSDKLLCAALLAAALIPLGKVGCAVCRSP